MENKELQVKESELARKVKKLHAVRELIETKRLEIERTENKTMKGKMEKQLAKQLKLQTKLEGKISTLEGDIADLNLSVI